MEQKTRIFNFLIADDDTNLHFILKRFINDIGEQHQITAVYNGVQLLDYILRRGPYKNFNNRLPDCIFLDLNLPVISGRNILKLINENALFGHFQNYVHSGKFDVNEKVILIDRTYAKYGVENDKNDLEFVLDEILEQISFISRPKANAGS